MIPREDRITHRGARCITGRSHVYLSNPVRERRLGREGGARGSPGRRSPDPRGAPYRNRESTARGVGPTLDQGKGMTGGATLPLRIGSSEPGLSIFSSGTTHVIIDVTGYYEPQIYGLIEGDGSWTGSIHLMSVNNYGPDPFTLTFLGM